LKSILLLCSMTSAESNYGEDEAALVRHCVVHSMGAISDFRRCQCPRWEVAKAGCLSRRSVFLADIPRYALHSRLLCRRSPADIQASAWLRVRATLSGSDDLRSGVLAGIGTSKRHCERHCGHSLPGMHFNCTDPAGFWIAHGFESINISYPSTVK